MICPNKLLDEANQPAIQQLTPKLIPVLEAVVSPPADQLDDETRDVVRKIVAILLNADRSLFNNCPNVLKLAGLA